jgi:hypothetical protein
MSTAAAAISPLALMAPAAASVPTAIAVDTGFPVPASASRRFTCLGCFTGLDAGRFEAAFAGPRRFADTVR